jgi:hypothetical protein
MNLLMSASLGDWVALAVGILGLALSYLSRRDRLPKWVRGWLSRIGQDKIEDAIEYAAKLQGLTSEQRRQEAVAYIIRLTEKELGLVIPESIANLLVEYVYQQWKRR